MKRLPTIEALLVCVALLFPLSPVFSHSGGLNSSGCHAGSKPYHCHRSPSEMVGNRLRCDLGSRSKECTQGQSGYMSRQRAYDGEHNDGYGQATFTYADGSKGTYVGEWERTPFQHTSSGSKGTANLWRSIPD